MQKDMEALGDSSDGGFGEAGDLEEAPGDGGLERGVEGGGGFGLVGSSGGAWIKIGAWPDGDFDIVKGAFSFDHTAPAEGETGFGEGSDFVGKLAAVGAGFEGGDGVAVESETDAEIKD